MSNIQKKIGEVEKIIAEFLSVCDNDEQRKDLLVLKSTLYSLKLKNQIQTNTERFL